MTQKANLFKGQKKQKAIPPNRHGKAAVTRKGKRFVKPSNVTKDMEADQELTKFINQCNEVKAATAANKEGGQLSIIKMAKDMNASQELTKLINQSSKVKAASAGNKEWEHLSKIGAVLGSKDEGKS